MQNRTDITTTEGIPVTELYFVDADGVRVTTSDDLLARDEPLPRPDPIDGGGVITLTVLSIVAVLLVAAFFIGRWSASW